MSQPKKSPVPGAPPPGPPRPRQVALDALRGLFLLWMALNHVPCALGFLTRQPLGFVTAAEGFILLAGVLVGLVYTKRFTQEGKTAATRHLLRRVCVVYRAHLITVAAVLVWMGLYALLSGSGRPPVGTPWIWFEQPLGSLLATVFLLHQPGLLDVLPLYCGCLLITPLALRQLMRGRRTALLAGSALVWAFTNVAVPSQPTVYGVINTGAFNFGAWQFLYLLGVAAGHARATAHQAQALHLSRPLLAASALICVLLLAARHGWFTAGQPEAFWRAWSNKNDLAPLRLLNVLALAMLLNASLVDRGRRPPWLTLRSRPLELLGRHSLVVFATHAVLALIILGLPAWFEWTRWGPWVGPTLLLAAMFGAATVADRLARSAGGRQARPS